MRFVRQLGRGSAAHGRDRPTPPDRRARMRSAARTGAVMFLVGGCLALFVLLVFRPPGSGLFLALAVLDLVMALLLWRLPWVQWPPWTLLVAVLAAYVIIGLFDIASAHSPYVYPLFFVLVAVWIGLFLPPRTSLWLAPVTVAAYLGPLLWQGLAWPALVSVVVVGPICMLVGDVIASAVGRFERELDERARVELQLAEAQRLAHLGSWQWSLPTNTLTFSTELYRIVGLDRHTFEGTYQAFLNHVHPDDRDQLQQLVAQAVQTHQPFCVLYRILRPDGTVRVVEARGAVVLGADGIPTSLLGTALDVTERTQDEEELRRTLADLEVQYHAAERARSESRAVLDAANEVMVLLAPDQRVISVNRRFADLFGLPPDAVVGHRLPELQSSMDRIFAGPAGQDFLREAGIAFEATYHTVVTQQWPAARELELYATPVRSSDGGQVGQLLVFRDVTREREVDRMKSSFVSLASHELRTPLTSVKGYVDLLLAGEGGDLAAEQRRLLQIASTNADRLVSLINDLLDIARIEFGQGRAHARRAGSRATHSRGDDVTAPPNRSQAAAARPQPPAGPPAGVG